MKKTFKLMLMALALVLGIPAGAYAQDDTKTYTIKDGEYTNSYGGDYAAWHKKWVSSDGVVTITANSNYNFWQSGEYYYLMSDSYTISVTGGYVLDSYKLQMKGYWGNGTVTLDNGTAGEVNADEEEYTELENAAVGGKAKVTFTVAKGAGVSSYGVWLADGTTFTVKKGEDTNAELTYGLSDGKLCGNENAGYYSSWQSNDGKLVLAYENGYTGFNESGGYYYLFPGKVKVRAAKGYVVKDYAFWASPYGGTMTIKTDDGGEFEATSATEEGGQGNQPFVKGKGDGTRITHFTIEGEGSITVYGSSDYNPFNIVGSTDEAAQADDPDGESVVWGESNNDDDNPVAPTNGTYGFKNGTFSDQVGQYYKTWESVDGKLKIQATTPMFQKPASNGTVFIKPGKMVVTAAKGYQIDEYMMWLYTYYGDVNLVTSDGFDGVLSADLSEDGEYVPHQVMGSPTMRRVILNFSSENASAIMSGNSGSNYFYFALSENDDPEIDNVPDPDTDIISEEVTSVDYSLGDGHLTNEVNTKDQFIYAKKWITSDGVLSIEAVDSPEDQWDIVEGTSSHWFYFYARKFVISVTEGHELVSYQFRYPQAGSSYDMTLTTEDGQVVTIEKGQYAPGNNFTVENINAQSTTLEISSEDGGGYVAVYGDPENAYSTFTVKNLTTGISISEATPKAASRGIFDLQGRQVQKPQKGIYIVDGKKVIIK